MDLCIDQGNSQTKVGFFIEDKFNQCLSFESFSVCNLISILKGYQIKSCIISSVTHNQIDYEEARSYCEHFVWLDHLTSLPIINKYKTPETLGKDRLAAVVGAFTLKPDSNLLVIDVGTAITYDFIDSNGIYYGGNIAPGISLRLKSLHEFTKKLPLVEVSEDFSLLGKDTNSAIVSGVMYGIVFEIDGYINEMKFNYSELSSFLTGGNYFYFAKKLKSPIFAEDNLVLIGLNRILKYNV